MTENDKKSTAAFRIQEALQQFSQELLSESGNLSAQTKEEIEKLIAQKLNDVDSALGKEKQETKRQLDEIHAKMLYLDKLVSGDFEKKKSIEQNNQNKVSFSNNFDFLPTGVKYSIGGKEYIGQINSTTGEVSGEKVISGTMGIRGDGNQQGLIKFDGVLDPGTKIQFLGKNKGISGQLEEIRVMLKNIEATQKQNAIEIQKHDLKLKSASDALK